MKQSHRTLIIIGLGIVSLAVLAFGGWVAYKAFFAPKEMSQSATAEPKTSDLLAALQKKAETTKAWEHYIVAQNDETKQSSNAYVYTLLGSKNVPIGLQPTTSLRITQEQGAPYDAASLSNVHKVLDAELEANGIKTETFSLPQTILGAYTGGGLHCSLNGSTGASFVSLACTTTQDAHKQLTTVSSLLKLHDDTTTNPTYLRFGSASDNANTHTVASIDSFTAESKKVHSFIYTADGDKWTYVDDAFGSPQKSGGGKTLSTPKLDDLLNDATYGPLYKTLIGAVAKPRQL